MEEKGSGVPEERERAGAAADPRAADDTSETVVAPRADLLLDSMAVGVYAVDRHGRASALNRHAAETLGYPPREFIGASPHELIHRDADGFAASVRCPLLDVISTGTPASSPADVFAHRDGSLLPVWWTSSPLVVDGAVVGAVIVWQALDGDDERERARGHESRPTQRAPSVGARAATRLGLLAKVTAVLTGTLDLHEALRRLARLVVPELADWSVVDLLEEPDRPHRVAFASSADVDAEALLGPLPNLPPDGVSPLAEVLRGADPVLLADMSAAPDDPDPLHAAELELFGMLGAASAIVAPLRARGRVLGALTLVRTAAEHAYTPADVTLVDDLARRAALAVDNARLYGVQQHVAETLQRSMLAELPPVPGLELAGRYRPARETAQVGGDWYDAFLLRDGVPALVIGDVVGHDLEAAVRMGQLRNILRGVAVDTGAPPSEVLYRVDEVIAHLQVADLVTGVYARLEGEPGGDRVLTWSNAGHPAPLVVSTDGSTRLLEEPTGLLLGLQPARRHDGRHPLVPGSTVLLYTDGLVESRTTSLDEGLARLRELAGPLAGVPLDELCDTLLAELAADATDDVALLAVRLPATGSR